MIHKRSFFPKGKYNRKYKWTSKQRWHRTIYNGTPWRGLSFFSGLMYQIVQISMVCLFKLFYFICCDSSRTNQSEKHLVSFIWNKTCFRLYFNTYMPTKKYLRKKGKKIMYKGLNCDRKSQLSGILTEPWTCTFLAYKKKRRYYRS